MSEAPPDVAVSSLESSWANSAEVPVVLEEKLDLAVVLVPDVGHFMMMEDPERFNAVLIEVVEGLCG